MKQDWKPGTMIYPLPALLVSCGSTPEDYNLFTVAWAGTICTNPAMCYISVRPERHSYALIKQNMEFVLNLTTEDMAYATDWCGVRSGRDYRKFEEMKLTPGKARMVAAPIVEACGCTLWDVEYVKEGSDWYLRVYIDKEGGITVDDCEVISREFNEVLDKENYIPDQYIFEVSSPGLLRPLKKEKDYQRSIGKLIDIKLYRAEDKQKEFTGVLKAYDEKTVTLAFEKDEEKTFERANLAMIRLAFCD